MSRFNVRSPTRECTMTSSQQHQSLFAAMILIIFVIYKMTESDNFALISPSNMIATTTDDDSTMSTSNFDTCTSDSDPIWSNPKVINQNFGVLYFLRVPRTGSRSWKYRMLDISKILQQSDSRDHKHNHDTLTFKHNVKFQTTFLGPNKYESYANSPVDNSSIIEWQQSFSRTIYLAYLDANIAKLIDRMHYETNESIAISISKSIAGNNIDFKYFNVHVTSFAQFPFVNDFGKLNQLWLDSIREYMHVTKARLFDIDCDHNNGGSSDDDDDDDDDDDEHMHMHEHDLDLKLRLQLRLGLLQKLWHTQQGIYLSSKSRSLVSEFTYSISKIRISWVIYLRDPISQQISKFYSDRLLFRKQYAKFPEILHFTFDDCVDSLRWIKDSNDNQVETLEMKFMEDNELLLDEYLNNPCRLSLNYFTRWLCGIGDECKTIPLTQKSLDKAIFNLNTYFDFVGVVEYYEPSWKFLTMKFPVLNTKKQISFGQEYEHRQRQKQKRGNTFSQHDGIANPSRGVIKKLKQWLQWDVKLYDYVKKRFEKCILPTVSQQ